METALKIYQFYSRFKSVPGEIANIAPYVPSAIANHLIEQYTGEAALGEAALGEVAPGQGEKVTRSVLVVLVHGTDGGDWQWLVARQYLKDAGYQSKCLSYNSQNRVADSCSSLFTNLQAMLEEEAPGRNFVLIGHSQGGLLARMLYERSKTLPVPCTKVFILHAPQKGTSAARLWNKLRSSIGLSNYESLKDMEDGTEFVNYYKEHCVDPQDPCVYEAAGSLDYVREDEAFYSSLPSKRYVGHYGHYSPMVDKSLWHTFIIPNLEADNNNDDKMISTNC